MKTIGEIKEEFSAAREADWNAICQMYETDLRSGVQKLVQQYRKKLDALEKEKLRMEQMMQFEHKYEHLGYLCGIDEVGRGPLAGPVVACAVILPKDHHILYLNDSKKLSASRREELYDEIMEKAVATGIGMASPARIDEINILQATYEAMREAVSKLSREPDLLLNDAVTIPEMTIMQVPIIKGDAKSVSIAAASILAKVTRDRLMIEYDKILPEYGFAGHKGYGSKEHIAAIQKYGPSPIHRRTFIKNFMNVSVQMTEKRMKKIQKNRRKTGADYEKAAGFYLEQMGYEILQFNYRCRLGEIDLIAKDGAYYVFCEVKYRADERKGSPLEAVDARKQQKIFRTAMYYLTEQQLEDVPCRFDVVGIEGTKITLIKNAFGG